MNVKLPIDKRLMVHTRLETTIQCKKLRRQLLNKAKSFKFHDSKWTALNKEIRRADILLKRKYAPMARQTQIVMGFLSGKEYVDVEPHVKYSNFITYVDGNKTRHDYYRFWYDAGKLLEHMMDNKGPCYQDLKKWRNRHPDIQNIVKNSGIIASQEHFLK